MTTDEGRTIKVAVRFTDSVGFNETVVSDASGVVAAPDVTLVAVTVNFEEGTYTVAEGSSVSVKVTRSADPERTVIIPLTMTNEGGATNADYSGVPTDVTFNSGDMEQTITFTAVQDMEDDDGESVKLSFGTLPAEVSAGTINEATVSITDDDGRAVTLSRMSLTIEEGTSGTYMVKLASQPTGQVTVTVNDPTNTDVTAEPPSLIFTTTDWSTEQTMTVYAAHDDDVADEDATVTHTVSGADYDSIGVPNVIVTVNDDDPEVTVSFGEASYTVAEGATEQVTVNLSADPNRTVAIPISTSNQSGTADTDYSVVPANLTFNSGVTQQTISFAATQDEEDDDGESVKLSFGTLPTGVSAGTTNETTVYITDDDGEGVNAPAIGQPRISRTAQVGQTLTADTSAITDPNGIPANVTYSYRWLSSDDHMNYTNIANATASTYTLVATDEGKGIKVEVSFIDSAGFSETVASDATTITWNIYLHADNQDQKDIWSDGETMWVADWADHKLYAYDLTPGTTYGARDTTKEFSIRHNNVPWGIWSDETTMWVADGIPDKLFAYRMTDDPETTETNEYGDRDPSRDFDLYDAPYDSNGAASGIWSDGKTMWVVDISDDKFYAYRMTDDPDTTDTNEFGARDRSKEFNLHADNHHPTGIWSDGTTMWVAEPSEDKVFAYHLTDDLDTADINEFGARDQSREFDLDPATGISPNRRGDPDGWNGAAGGIWSNGKTMWVADTKDYVIYSYPLPKSSTTE